MGKAVIVYRKTKQIHGQPNIFSFRNQTILNKKTKITEKSLLKIHNHGL